VQASFAPKGRRGGDRAVNREINAILADPPTRQKA